MIFLRPWYLLLLLILPLLIFHIKASSNKFSTWSKIVDKELFDFLKSKTKKHATNNFWWLILLGIFSLIIAISGPSWQKVDVPNYKEQNAIMIAIDLSSDTSQKDLEKFKFDIIDIINQTKDLNIGLSVFANEAYVVSPITEDKNLIKNLLPQINHSIMPENGNDIKKATAFAKQKLKDAGFYNGEVIILSNNTNTNIQSIINKLNSKTNTLEKSQEKTQNWLDMGYYFLFLPTLICLYLFRRGLFIILMLFSFNAQANIFLNADQKGLQSFNNKDYKNAATQFKNKDWQASSMYKAGDFKKAINLFSDEYNQGNALAKSGNIKEAIKKYETVLKKDPNHKDAKFNLEYLKKQKDQNQNNNDSKNNQEQNKDDSKQDQNNKNQDKSQQQQQQEQEQESQKEKKEGQEQQAQAPQNQEDKDNKEEEEKQAYSEKAQAREQKFREIPEDVGGLLRAYIYKQHIQKQRGK